MFGREANCCSRVYWIIVLLLLALLTVGGIWESIAGLVWQRPKVSWSDKPITEIRFPVVHFHNFNQIRFNISLSCFVDLFEVHRFNL